MTLSNTLKKTIGGGIAALVLTAGFAQAVLAQPPALMEDAGRRVTPTPAASAITQAEKDGLLQMREEEKLARDVYTALYAQWQLPAFGNIIKSEQTHMDAVKNLLTTFGLPDPAANQPAGVFTNPELQALYDDLVAQGSESAVAALRVGATIEDLDIFDLNQFLTATNNAAIKQVYANLKFGSENHLRAFARQLGNYGQTYTPQYLTPAQYNAIIAAGGRGRR